MARRESYLVCPGCGWKQKSQARRRVRCHRCGRGYDPGSAKVEEKRAGEQKGLGFFKYRRGGDGEE